MHASANPTTRTEFAEGHDEQVAEVSALPIKHASGRPAVFSNSASMPGRQMCAADSHSCETEKMTWPATANPSLPLLCARVISTKLITPSGPPARAALGRRDPQPWDGACRHFGTSANGMRAQPGRDPGGYRATNALTLGNQFPDSRPCPSGTPTSGTPERSAAKDQPERPVSHKATRVCNLMVRHHEFFMSIHVKHMIFDERLTERSAKRPIRCCRKMNGGALHRVRRPTTAAAKGKVCHGQGCAAGR